MSTYGLPSAVNVVAFDCVAGLLAVGKIYMYAVYYHGIKNKYISW